MIPGELAGSHLAVACLLAVAELGLSLGRCCSCVFGVKLANSRALFGCNKRLEILTKRLLDRCARPAVGAVPGQATGQREDHFLPATIHFLSNRLGWRVLEFINEPLEAVTNVVCKGSP